MAFTVWALHEKVGRWIRLEQGLSGPEATATITLRQDRARRAKEPVRFVVRTDGRHPDE